MKRRTITVLLFCGAVLTLGGIVGLAQQDPTGPQGKLSQAQAEQLAKLEATINKHDDAGEFGEAVRLAREALGLREQWQGPKHWETVDARFRIERWQRLADLPVDKQKKLAPAIRLLGQGSALYSTPTACRRGRSVAQVA